MNIKNKIIFIVAFSLVILIFILGIISRTIFLKKFEQLERESKAKDLNRVEKLIDRDLFNLSVTTRDYASWDDTYIFIENSNDEYIKRNIIEQTFIELNINLMIFIDNKIKIKLIRIMDLNKKKFIDIDSSIFNFINNHSPFIHPDIEFGYKGIVKLNSGTMLLASRAILTSESKGPKKGVVIFGRYFNGNMVNKISSLSLTNVNLYDIIDTLKIQKLFSESFNDKRYYFDEENPDSISVYTIINDYENKPINIINICEKKTIVNQGSSSIYFFFLYISLVSIIFFIVLYIYISRLFSVISEKVKVETVYKKLFDTSPIAIVITDFQGVIEEINNEGQKLFLLGNINNINIFNLIYIDGYSDIKSILKNVCASGGTAYIEVNIQSNNNKLIASCSVSRLSSENDKNCKFLFILKDITANKVAEQNLKEERALLNAIVKNNPNFIYIFDNTLNKIIFYNRNLFEYLGYSKDDYRYEYFGFHHELIHPQDIFLFNEMLKKLSVPSDSDYIEYEIRLLSSKNEWLWFFVQEVIFKKDENNKILQILGTISDITEQKLTELILREQTQKLSQINESLQKEVVQRKDSEEKLLKNKFILDSIGDAVFTLDENNRITSFNKIAENITGLKANEVINEDCFTVLDFIIKNEKLTQLIKEKEIVSDFQTSVTNINGKTIPISISSFILKDPDNHISEMIITLRDISEIETLRKEIKKDYNYFDIITNSPKIKKILDILPDIAVSDSAVLIEGATGTGKELLAKSIHKLSNRKDKPFIVINCGAIPSQLLESELFGFVKGAFTDAKYNKTGKIVLADKGTVFFDEIGELPLDMQVKILRLLENFEVEPIGSSKPIKVNIRVIAATNKNLKQMVDEGNFRDDLYYRLNTVKFYLPSLNERKEDLPHLIDHFIQRFNLKFNKNIIELSSNAMRFLYDYSFPGNIRELEKILEYAFIVCKNRIIDIKDLPPDLVKDTQLKITNVSKKTLSEKEKIIELLEKHNGDKYLVCKELNIHYTTLWRKLKKYNLFEYIKM